MTIRLVNPDVIFNNTLILTKKCVLLVKFKTARDAVMLQPASSANKDSVCKKMNLMMSVLLAQLTAENATLNSTLDLRELNQFVKFVKIIMNLIRWVSANQKIAQ